MANPGRIAGALVAARRRKSNLGFTLVEVMVALAVVAIALPALMSQLIQFMDGSEYIRDKSYAYWVAQNQLEMLRVEYALSETLLKGKTTGESEMADRTWYWEIESVQEENQKALNMWKQTVSVGVTKDNFLVSVVGYMRETPSETRQ